MLFLLFLFTLINSSLSEEITISMPGVQTDRHDQYLCTAVKLSNASLYIRKFSVNSDASKAHHLILFGCNSLSDNKIYPSYWDCGYGSICNNGLSIKYAWAKNAPPTKLPEDVGFEIGSKESKVNYLVLQIHYIKKMKKDEYDESSITLTVTPTMPKYIAGIQLLLATVGRIAAHSSLSHIDVNCQLKGRAPIHVFAYRTHAHKLGTVITGYRYRKKSTKKWQLIAKGNPQWPQTFYPMDKIYEVRPTDYLASRCTYNASNKDTDTKLGATESHEMCNLYLMYYVNSSHRFQYKECMDVQNPRLVMNLPLGNDDPLPANSAFEDAAHGDSVGDTTTETAIKDLNNSKYVYSGKEMVLNVQKLGQVTAITLDSDENLFIFHRGDKVWNSLTFDANNRYRWVERGPIKQSTILHVNAANGNIISETGSDVFYMPHGLTYDSQGYLWTTDVATHQVKKFQLVDGKIVEIKSFGQKFHPGSDNNHFCKPTSVAIATSGDFYVADGYCNSRILKFSSAGQVLAQWGGPSPYSFIGNSAPTGTFYIPHKVLLMEKKNLVCVADRENGRVQCFTANSGKLHSVITRKEFGGRLFSIAYSPANGGLLFGVNGPNNVYPVQGFIMNLTASQVIAQFSPKGTVNLSRPHDIAVSSDGNKVFIVEIGPNRIWKFNGGDVTYESGDGNVHAEDVSSKKSQTIALDVNNNNNKKVNKTISSVLPNSQLGTTLSVLAILAIPILILIIISIVLQMRKRGICMARSKHDKFNVGNFLNRHKGFDRVSTQEDDLDAIDSSDSDIEEFSVNKTKA